VTVAVDVAFGRRWAGPPLPRWVTAVLAVGLTTTGLVGLTYVFAGPATYQEVARANGFDRATFHVPGTAAARQRQEVSYDVATLVILHGGTLAYVMGDAEGTPRDPTTRDPLFSEDEQRHLADVRAVFGWARAAALVGLGTALSILLGATRRGRLVLVRAVRDAAVVAGVLVALVGITAAVAFGPAFLAFHYLFFPQGNFLFDPATSNLLALYPESYWYAVTIRIAVTFLGVAALVAGALTTWLRRSSAR
jgi:integral membrane protein (TIGR01906 family)